MSKAAARNHRREPGSGKKGSNSTNPRKTAPDNDAAARRRKTRSRKQTAPRQNKTQPDRPTKRQAPPQKRRSLKDRFQQNPWFRAASSIALAIAIGLIAPQLVLAAYGWRSDLPRTYEIHGFLRQPTLSMTVSADGSEPGDCVCFLPIVSADIPDHLREALLASEDRRFELHRGIDLIGTLRAALANLGAGRVVQGGSTVTQQLAKSLVGNQRTRDRKLRELVVARRIEAAIDKDEILRLYLDRAYFGRGATGIEAAARRFFGKQARDLTLFEAAALIGRLPAPSSDSSTAAHVDNARLVLERMVAAEMITPAQARAALSEGAQPGGLEPHSIDIRHYAAWVGRELRNAGVRGQVQVVLAVDLSHQMAAQSVVDDAITRNQLGPEQEVALAAIAPDGRVTALVGGRNYAISQFDRATQARRQPASAVKPFTFLTALEQGWSPEQLIDDAPIRINGWQPRNHDRLYMGEITLHTALQRSRNAATVRLAEKVGIDAVADTFERFGLPSDQERPAFLLGAEAIRLLDLAEVYASLAASGRRIASTGFLAILETDGNVVMRAPASSTNQIANPDTVATLNTMLDGAASGDGLAGKSGTSQRNRDAWFVGFSNQATAAVWVGRDDSGPMPGTYGGGVSARIWQAFLEAIKPPS